MKTKRKTTRQRIINLGLAAVAAQAGCATLLIVGVALFSGLWLDAQAGQRGLFTFGLLIISVPFSLYVMLKIALGAINRMNPQPRIQPENPTDTLEEV